MTDSRDHAMIVAQYTDCRAYRGLGVVRITCELPVEYEADVHRLIGYPAKDRALILSVANPEQVKTFGAPPKPSPAEQDNGMAEILREQMERRVPASKRERVPFDELKPSQQAGILCADPEFWEFLYHKTGYRPGVEEQAAMRIRSWFDIESRAELNEPHYAAQWATMVSSFRAYQTENRYSGTPAYEASR